MMDRFTTCGSKRPCFISDSSIVLRLPSLSPHVNGLQLEGEMFNAGPNVQYSSDSRRKGQGAASLLIDITRILGITNKYLAAGGVKGDSHFPWHSLSNLSKIRQQLDIWAAGTQDVFVSIDALFGHPECTTLLLSKLIYHLVHCLIYRPFLPVDLVELRGSGQHQSWQIEATNLCFSHSNAIAELVELGKNSPLVEWPAFVGYCVCTAGTVHVHGVHYKGREGEVYSPSADFLAKEMHQLSWLRSLWAGVQHQREMLQTIYTCHSELVRTLSSNPMRFSPVFHLEDFFDRYPGLTVDGSYMKLVDMVPAFNEKYVSSEYLVFIVLHTDLTVLVCQCIPLMGTIFTPIDPWLRIRSSHSLVCTRIISCIRCRPQLQHHCRIPATHSGLIISTPLSRPQLSTSVFSSNLPCSPTQALI